MNKQTAIIKKSEMKSYSSKYSDSSFWKKLGRIALKAGAKVVFTALTLYYCMKDPDTPAKVKIIIASVLGYLIMPLDLIPDAIPMVGLTDDAAALFWALAEVSMYIKEEHKEMAAERMKVWFGSCQEEYC